MSMAAPEFLRDMTFAYGEAATLSPLVRRVIARNPSAFTFHGTGTYIVGRGTVAVIDPGPDEPEHVDALLEALDGETVSHILVTHTHIDHSPGAARFKSATGAKTYAFGGHPRHPDGSVVEQGGDLDFQPDEIIGEGDAVTGPGWTLEALHTPGHISNHLCFALPEERALFSGDHVMGWSTSVISPPDGNMADYFASLRKLLPRDDRLYYPTHGPAIPAPLPHVQSFIAHRQAREDQILACVRDGLTTVPAMVARIYETVPRHLHPAAARSVQAHLAHMIGDGRLALVDGEGLAAVYRAG
jgi:glyoxylase-like metal-dependent hydrolase (beta-lactamase superfamily II)